MMSKTNRTRTILAAIGIAGALTGTTLAATGNANGETLYQYDRVRYMFCGDTTATLDYTNVYGNKSQETHDLTEGCRFYDFTVYDEYGSYGSAALDAENGGTVSCTIWRNGTIVARSNDTSPYYAYASCY